MSDGEAERRAASTPLGALLSGLTQDISILFRQEVALAKSEISDSAKQAGKGAGLLGGAAVAALMTLLFLSITAWWALGHLIGNAWSALVVAGMYAVVAIVLLTRGRRQLRTVRGAPSTVESLQQIPDTLTPGGTA